MESVLGNSLDNSYAGMVIGLKLSDTTLKGPKLGSPALPYVTGAVECGRARVILHIYGLDDAFRVDGKHDFIRAMFKLYDWDVGNGTTVTQLDVFALPNEAKTTHGVNFVWHGKGRYIGNGKPVRGVHNYFIQFDKLDQDVPVQQAEMAA